MSYILVIFIIVIVFISKLLKANMDKAVEEAKTVEHTESNSEQYSEYNFNPESEGNGGSNEGYDIMREYKFSKDFMPSYQSVEDLMASRKTSVPGFKTNIDRVVSDSKKAAKPAKVNQELKYFTIERAVIFSEILKPKYQD